MKRFFLLVCVLCLGLCACGSDEPETAPGKSPKEIVSEFVRAMYVGDLDGFFVHIPEFAFDALIEMEGLEIPEGKTKADVAYDYFADNMAQEPEDLVTEVTVETKISTTVKKKAYMETARTYYVAEGVVSEEDLEKIEDVVCVAFNCDVTYENGQTFSLTDFRSVLPCVKLEGKWYVDILYLVCVPVQAASPTPVQ